MRKMVLIVVVSALSLVGAHAGLGFESQKRGVVSNTAGAIVPAGVQSPHATAGNSRSGTTGMTGVIQRASLPDYKAMTIGEAFGKYGYLKKKEWRETRAANGNIFIDFTGYVPAGWFDFKMKKAGVSARGLEVKFVIYPDGAYGLGMVSNVEVRTDGKIYRTPRTDAKTVLDAIYANQKFKL
ncbi:hypothetical protein [Geotalea toluenoxydans]|uniref:hypothetical protein n=1 Tax=Geotalea toluenoxydans TaxID=421624 RepID=UPI000B3397AB|nr:hypothetical protein [Geotalea toluenoxydans]